MRLASQHAISSLCCNLDLVGLPRLRPKYRAVTVAFAGRTDADKPDERGGRSEGNGPPFARSSGGALLSPRSGPKRYQDSNWRSENREDSSEGDRRPSSRGPRDRPPARSYNDRRDGPRQDRRSEVPRPGARAAADVDKGDVVTDRGLGRRSRPAGGAGAAAEPQDPFESMHSRLTQKLAEGVIVRKETWEKLLGHLRVPSQAAAALELMLADARVRTAAGWDWATHGYGQTAYQLVQAAAAAGAPEVAEQLLASREDLHLRLNKDMVPTLMRKVAAAAADFAADGDDADEHVEVVQRLYDQEAALRGTNSAEAAYELSRVLRRAEDVGGVRSLHAQMVREDLALRDRLLDDIEKWLAKRGVRV